MKKILFIFITLIAISCKKDNPESISEFDLSINQFIWNNMSNYYLWSDYVPALNSNNYSSKNDIEENLLRKYSDHEKFFDTLLYSRGSVDKYSFIVNNYENYEASNNGSGRSMGFYYKLFLMYNKEIIGLVMYVVKGGPADRAGIKRGDFFTEIDGSKLTPVNYKNLLSKDSYNISLAKYSYTTETVEYSGVPHNLTSEIMQENPIFLDTVYSINSHKVGYIIYNYFDGNYDNQLNMIFSKFKQENISDLILDLRYNGGGEYTSAINLASMIYTTDENKIFGKNEYNKALQQKLVRSSEKNI